MTNTMQFWSRDPAILFNKEYLLELWPTASMCYEQKLNAITRLVLLITILGYVFTFSPRILVVGGLTIATICILYSMRKPQSKITSKMVNEGFNVLGSNGNGNGGSNSDSLDEIVNPVTLEKMLKSNFKEGNKKNPFSNVLLTEIGDEPNRNAAPPAFNVGVEEDITKNVKRSVQMMNPGISNTNRQLYDSLWDKFELDQSNRIFYSTANTRVANDQSAYANFLYGYMPSAKESNAEGAMARVQDNYRYILY